MNKKIINILLIIVIIIEIVAIPNKCRATIEDILTLQKSNVNEVLPYTYDGKNITMYQRLNYAGLPVYNLNEEWLENEETFINKVKVYDNETLLYILKNGYPNKDAYEIGCENWVEAYIATQEAICKILYNRDIYLYESTDVQGERILNAMKRIINSSKEELELLKLKCKNEQWKEYSEDNNYLYKEYSAEFSKIIENGNISVKNGENIKILGYSNNEKTNINQIDTIKILAPNNISQDINVTINVEIVNYIPYLYSSNNRNYIVFEKEKTDFEQDINLELNVTSNIKVININEYDLPIPGNKFELLDSEYNVIQQNLVTDTNGEILINDVGKGIYYLKQERAINGYDVNTSLVEINVSGMENTLEISVKNLETIQEETTVTNKHINFVENHKTIVEENIKQVDNITVDNITKEIFNTTNETNTKIVNNFVNTTNNKNVLDYVKNNNYFNTIKKENYETINLEGVNKETQMTREDFINYIDLLKSSNIEIPKLPEACK